MAKWIVTLPVAGSVMVFVEAQDAIGAEEAAFNAVDFRIEPVNSQTEIGEFETLREITQGNVFHGPVNEICVEPDEDTED